MFQVQLASRKLVRTLSAFLPAKRPFSHKEPFLRPRGSGKLFLPIHRMEELCQHGLQNGYKNGASLRSRWTTIWRSTSLGHDKASTAESVQNMEHEISQKSIGFDLFMKEAARQDSSTVRIPKIPWLTSEQFKDTLVEYQLTWVDGYILIPYNWKEYIFHRGCSFSIQSILENGLIPGGKESKGGRQTIFFTPLNPFGGDSDEEEPRDDYTIPQKVHYHSIGNVIRCRLLGKIIPSTRSRIAILANEVTCNHRTQSCASRLHLQSNLSKRRSNTVRKTLNPTTRAESHTEKQLAFAAAAAVSLWWCVDQYKETCTGEPIWDKRRQRLHNGWSDSTRRLVRDPEPAVEKKPQFEIDLRVEGVSQDAILQIREDERNQRKSWKVEIGSGTKSIRNDLSKGNMIFSEESSRAIYEMGNMELIELRQTSATIQCPSCLKHVPEGLNMCQCGVWLRPNQSTMDRIRTAFAAFENSLLPFHSNPVKRKEKWSQPMADGSSKSHGCKKRSTETHKYTSTVDRWQNDEVYRASQLVHGWTEEWVKYLDYISKIDISHDAPYRQRLRYESTIYMRGVDSNKQAGPLCQRPDYHHQQMLLSAFNELKAKEYLIFQCICGQDSK